MLQIEDLQIKLGDKEILKHINLEIHPAETHILFGPNGSGKTSLLMTIMGYPQYSVTASRILFKGEDITHMSVNERTELGIDMSYQRPQTIRGFLSVDIPGLPPLLKAEINRAVEQSDK